MVSTSTVIGAGENAAEAHADFETNLARVDTEPDFAFVFYGCKLDDAVILAALKQRWPELTVIGGTSSRGVVSRDGMAGAHSVGAFLIRDPDGDYGAAAVPLGDDPAGSAKQALEQALDNADCPGELPELIWIYQAPGNEEAVLDGLRDVVGDRCPIVGGSSADDTVSGEWRQLGPDGAIEAGIAVAVLFTSGGVSVAFEGGYEPTENTGVVTGILPSENGGVVTKAEGRLLATIDDRPAAEVLNEWVGGSLEEKLNAGGSILADTTLTPLGINPKGNDAFSQYLLIHPAAIRPDGTVETFATIAEGSCLVSMRGDRKRLVERAGRVADVVNARYQASDALAGGIVVYCGGCMMAVDDEMSEVAEGLSNSFGEAPFLGCFTFGEQGPVLGTNMHGNLMISAIAFGR